MKHGNQQSVTAGQLVGPARTAEIASRTATPIRSAWWMKHLALLTLLQAACLAASTWPLPLILVSLVQAALSCLIFSRMHHRWRHQEQQSEADLKQHRVDLSRTQNAVIIGLTQLAE